MTLISNGTTAEILGISLATVKNIINTNTLGSPTFRGKRCMLELEQVQSIAERPHADLENGPRSLIVRVGAPREVDEEWRSHIGWDSLWDDETKSNAVRGDWKIKSKSIKLPVGLIVLCGIQVVSVYRAVSAEQIEDRLRFIVEPPTKTLSKAYEGKLIRLPAGPVIMRVGK